MASKQRLQALLDKLEKENIVYTNELVELYQVSEPTIRRDLTRLENEGKLKRIPGGAVKVQSNNVLVPSEEIWMQNRLNINVEAKKEVCARACQEIQDGECIFIDGGSSLMYMIDYLKDRNVRIVTHNHLIVSKMVGDTKAQLITLGGDYMNEYAMSVGSETIRQVSNYNFDRCFVGCAGVDIADNMSYTTEVDTAAVKEAAMANSARTYLLIDHDKIGIRAFCKFKALTDFDFVICDRKKEGLEYPDNFISIEQS